MADEYLDKFRITAEHKRMIKEAFIAIVDRQLDPLGETCIELFKGLPREAAESMTPKEATQYVDMVMKDAAESLAKGANALMGEVSSIAKDEAKMSKLRKEFLDSIGFKEDANER